MPINTTPTPPYCKLPALENLEMYRKPHKNPSLDRVRLLAFLPDPYVLPKHEGVSETTQKAFDDLFLANPDTQFAIKLHKEAIKDILQGKAIPFYAAVYDALPEPMSETDKLLENVMKVIMEKKGTISDNKLVQELTKMIQDQLPQDKSKSSSVSISDELAKKAQQGTNCTNESKAKLAAHDAKIKEILADFHQPKYKKLIKEAKNTIKSFFSKAASVIF